MSRAGDDNVRLLPMTDQIGPVVIRHGERDHLDPEHPEACLCGIEPYYLCPEPDGLMNLVLSLDDNGNVIVEENDHG